LSGQSSGSSPAVPRNLKEANKALAAADSSNKSSPSSETAIAKLEAQVEIQKSKIVSITSKLTSEVEIIKAQLNTIQSVHRLEKARYINKIDACRVALVNAKQWRERECVVEIQGEVSRVDSIIKMYLELSPERRLHVRRSFSVLACATLAIKSASYMSRQLLPRSVMYAVDATTRLSKSMAAAAVLELMRRTLHFTTMLLEPAPVHIPQTEDAEVTEAAAVLADVIGNTANMMHGKASLILSDGAATHTIATDESWLMPGTQQPSDVQELSSCEIGGGIKATMQGIVPTSSR